MDIYYDCEFLERRGQIELISIGMVDDDGESIYAVSEEIRSNEALYRTIRNHPWLMKHVIPHLPLRRSNGPDVVQPGGQFGGAFTLDTCDNRVMPRRMIRNLVREFVLARRPARLWAWYGAYDHVVTCWLFGQMIDLPAGFPMFTCDVRQEFERYGNPTYEPADGPAVGRVEHNALHDAMDVRDRLKWLRQRARDGEIEAQW